MVFGILVNNFPFNPFASNAVVEISYISYHGTQYRTNQANNASTVDAKIRRIKAVLLNSGAPTGSETRSYER